MIPVREFVVSLGFEVLAGAEGLGTLCRDVVLLSDAKVWLKNLVDCEYNHTVFFVKSDLFPGYSSTLDLLLRFFQQAGVVGVLFQGGKRTDFPKATLLLADQLRIPLIWVKDDFDYSRIARHFYEVSFQQSHYVERQFSSVRKELEQSFKNEPFLAGWLDKVEHALNVRANLVRVDTGKRSPHQATWVTKNGSRVLEVPIHVLDHLFVLTLGPQSQCTLFRADYESLWIDELSGVLSAQTGYLLLAELPGIFRQSEWACSFESVVYCAISTMHMMNDSIFGITHSGQASGEFPEIFGPLSTRRRLAMIQGIPISTIGMLWIGRGIDVVNQTEKNLRIVTDRPYSYRGFSQNTLNLRDQSLQLSKELGLAMGDTQHLTSCVPWADWRGNQGVVLFWFSSNADGIHGVEQNVRDFVEQLGRRLQASLKSYFFSKTFTQTESNQEIIHQLIGMTDRSYSDFLSVLSQPQVVQFANSQRDMANRILPGNAAYSSYQHAVRLLEPLLNESSGIPLLQALEVYLECGGKMQTAAEKLYLHRNTLRYRLKRVERLLKSDLEDDQTRFTYQLAIRTWRLRNPDLTT